MTYDAARRLTEVHLTPPGGDEDDEVLSGRLTYGEGAEDAVLHNLRTVAYAHEHPGGIQEIVDRDFQGNVTRTKQRLIAGTDEPDYGGTVGLDSVLYLTEHDLEALGRPATFRHYRAPDGDDLTREDEQTFGDDAGGRLTAVALDDSEPSKPCVSAVANDARGQLAGRQHSWDALQNPVRQLHDDLDPGLYWLGRLTGRPVRHLLTDTVRVQEVQHSTQHAMNNVANLLRRNLIDANPTLVVTGYEDVQHAMALLGLDIYRMPNSTNVDPEKTMLWVADPMSDGVNSYSIHSISLQAFWDSRKKAPGDTAMIIWADYGGRK